MTKQQITALRAALAAPGSDTERIAAGIDALRSPEFRQARAAYEVEVSMVKSQGSRAESDGVPKPTTERVPGSKELSEWLQGELRRIRDIGADRRKARYVFEPLPLRQRCEGRVRAAVRKAYKTCGYRKSESRWAGGEHSLDVAIGTVGAHGESERVWSDNKKWSGLNSIHRVGVLFSWKSQVERRGLAVVDNKLTLDAVEIAPDTFDAVWVVQGRGFELKVQRGTIRKRGGLWVHSKKVKAA